MAVFARDQTGPTVGAVGAKAKEYMPLLARSERKKSESALRDGSDHVF